MSETPKLQFVDVVTREHGEKFAQDWRDADSMEDACDDSEVIEWPEWDEAAQLRAIGIHDEIITRVYDELRSVIVETFVRIANEVLSRERSR